MTTTSALAPSRFSGPSPLSLDDLWQQTITLRAEGRTVSFPLTNVAGRCYPTLSADLMQSLLGIAPEERVLEVGRGGPSFSRANLVAEISAENGARQGGHALTLSSGIEATVCRAEALPFTDGEFDFAWCCETLARAADPAAACRELQRVAKRGFIETPSPMAQYLGASPAHRWLVHVERLPDQEPTLVFRRRAFVRTPFRHALRARWFQDADFRAAWEVRWRNLAYTQFAWEGAFAIRVEDNAAGFDYDDPKQAAEAHLDTAINGIRFGIPLHAVLPDTDRAIALRPDWAIAQNTRGCALWLAGRPQEAITAFQTAARLEPDHADYRFNAALGQEKEIRKSGNQEIRQSPNFPISQFPNFQPRLVLLPPNREDCEDIEENFGGKVYYAFVSYDDRLARDLKIQPGEKVLDVGGGQRPLKRADVSCDFDVFEGLHRQGQAISREKPLVCGDAQRLPFRDHAFDVACCRMVLEHVVDPAAACRELQRVAKRGFLETPNTFWEAVYGHPTHRWVIEWEASSRTLVFTRKPFDSIPFQCGIVPFLYTQRDIQRAFEVTFRNITTVQITWDEDNPFFVRVEDDPNCPYDYLNRPEDATRGSLNYARDLLKAGLAPVAVAEADDALRHAPTLELRQEALRLRLQLADLMNDRAKAKALREEIEGVQVFRCSGIAAPQPGIQDKAPDSTSQHLNTRAEGPIPEHLKTRTPEHRPPLVWNAPLLDPSGYADEARHFLFALDAAGVEVTARPIPWSRKVAVLPAERERILTKMMGRAVPANAVQVCHILAPHFQRDPSARACIGRTMFETDRLPDGWAEACNRMDAVWIPGEFNRQTFMQAGVDPAKLRMVPGAIDLKPYDPNCPPLQIEGARGFNFLSLFDWTLRKGWDVMVRAFAEEFRSEEDVALIIKTHSSLGYTVPQIVEHVGQFLTTLGHDTDRIPDIIFQDTNIPDARMPNLYRAADCYVMPTRGEGWGRPFMEAMAMGLPVIGTNWSGQTAFMNAENSYLLDYELVEVPETAWRETPTYRGHRWAEPSLPHLRQLMRLAFEDRQAGRERGQRARAHLEQHFTYGPVARILLEEIGKLGH